MKRLRGAIVGFGNVAVEAHLPGFTSAPGFAIEAVVDPSEARREAARAALPGAAVCASLEELAASGPKVDFVDVATPPRHHAGLVVEALGRGWHVLCEKPLAADAAGLESVRHAAAGANRAVFTVHNWKYAPLFRRLHGLVTAGTVGEPDEIDWSILRPNPPSGATAGGEAWRLDRELAGGGIVMDHGWHAFYLMLYLTGQAPRTIEARLRRERGLDVEDAADLTIVFGQARARVHLSWNASERKSFGVVRGPLGAIDVDDSTLTVRVEGREPESTRFAPPVSASSWHPEWFPPLLEDFRAEVLHPASRGRNLAEAAACAALTAAAYASQGAVVPVGSSGGAED